MSVVNHVVEDKSAADHRRKINEAATVLEVILVADDTAVINPESHANPLKNDKLMPLQSRTNVSKPQANFEL